MKDTLAHMAFWDGFRAEQLALMLAGRAAEVDYSDPDPINAREYAERGAWPLQQVVDEAQAARARFLALLASLTDQDLDRSFTVHPGYTFLSQHYFWYSVCAFHDLEHANSIEIRD
jgi:DinB superfamily